MSYDDDQRRFHAAIEAAANDLRAAFREGPFADWRVYLTPHSERFTVATRAPSADAIEVMPPQSWWAIAYAAHPTVIREASRSLPFYKV